MPTPKKMIVVPANTILELVAAFEEVTKFSLLETTTPDPEHRRQLAACFGQFERAFGEMLLQEVVP